MKTLSIIVPCYNSADYMERCINSLLLGGNQVEIILVDDGSHDQTPQIVNDYEQAFPTIVKAIHQSNGGHGQAINAGLRRVTGQYVKVVDSDDWLDAIAYHKMLSFLNTRLTATNELDMVISNFTYEKVGAKHKKSMRYPFLPEAAMFTWQTVHFPRGKYLLMHSVIYRTSLLIDEAKLVLPKHTFYVDELYVFEPLPYVNKMVYLNLDLYHYFIGRSDQSVNEQVMIRRIDQQLWVNKALINYFSACQDQNEQRHDYMEKYVEIITTISSVLLMKDGSLTMLMLKADLWQFIEKTNPKLYHELRRGAFGIGVHLPGTLGRKTVVGAYHIAQKMYGFN